MRSLILGLAATSLALGAGGCGFAGQLGEVPTPTTVIAEPGTGTGVLSQTLTDEKVLYAAEAAFKGVSLGLNSAVDAGLLKGTKAATAKSYYDRAYAALLIARKAQASGNNNTMVAQAAVVLGLVADVQRLLSS